MVLIQVRLIQQQDEEIVKLFGSIELTCLSISSCVHPGADRWSETVTGQPLIGEAGIDIERLANHITTESLIMPKGAGRSTASGWKSGPTNDLVRPTQVLSAHPSFCRAAIHGKVKAPVMLNSKIGTLDIAGPQDVI